MSSFFPENPTHGMLYEQKNGIIYQYDASTKSWIKIATDNATLAQATSSKSGLMTAQDLKKLNRLVVPPPISSIVGTDCLVPYQSGTINLYNGDEFVKVEGNVSVQNIDQYGDHINQSIPFQIHQNTYGFDFTLDLPQLVVELEKRGRISLVGKAGTKGEQGDPGDAGPNGILSGPQGDQGPSGSAPECTISVAPEDVQVQTKAGLKKGLVRGRVIPDVSDPRNYSLEFDRQVLGNESGTASQFFLKQIDSTWVLAIAALTDESVATMVPDQCGTIGEGRNQFYALYYLDIEPIVDTLHQKFLDEVQRLKVGYQNIVASWIHTMSDMFDEQKSALCCALENCMSITKSTQLRQHMESVSAAVVGKAKMNLHNRNSGYAVDIPSARLLPDDGKLCGTAQFPQGTTRDTEVLPSASKSSDPIKITVDPLLNSALTVAQKVNLPKGEYVATLKQTTAEVNGQFRGNVKLRHTANGEKKTIQFLDKGIFKAATEARSAYEGLSLNFIHDGGAVEFYLPSIQPRHTSGEIKIELVQVASTVPDAKPKQAKSKKSQLNLLVSDEIEQCQMSISHLSWYEKGWKSGRCCGLVVNVAGQDYIVVKRSVGTENNCGGGESLETPCIAKFHTVQGHPSFAWPTLDGKNFAPLPKRESITFYYDKTLNELIADKISKSDYSSSVGNPNGMRHLSYQLMTILFPYNY